MDRFIDCLIDGNLSRLVISGKPNIEELQSTWADIYENYLDRIGDTQQGFYLMVLKEVDALRTKVNLISNSIYLLSKIYHKPIADRLVRELGGKFTFDITNEESYKKDIKGLTNRSKSLEIDLQLKEAQLATLEEEQKGEPVTRDYFTVIFINLRDFAKYHVPETITVSEFCFMLKKLITQYEKAKNNGRR